MVVSVEMALARALITLVVAALLGASAATAHAHELVEEGRRRFVDADFDGALELYARAEAADDLTREDLISLYEGRALTHFALGELDHAQVALEQLATIAPSHHLSDEVPPELVEIFEEAAAAAGEGLRLRVDAERSADGVSLRPILEGDGVGIARSLSVAGRTDGEWTFGDESGLTLSIPASATVEYYAQVIGPGAAILASVGSEGEPATIPGEGGVGALPGWTWGLVGGGAGVLILVVIIAAVAASSSGSSTVPIDGPFVVMP